MSVHPAVCHVEFPEGSYDTFPVNVINIKLHTIPDKNAISKMSIFSVYREEFTKK